MELYDKQFFYIEVIAETLQMKQMRLALKNDSESEEDDRSQIAQRLSEIFEAFFVVHPRCHFLVLLKYFTSILESDWFSTSNTANGQLEKRQ